MKPQTILEKEEHNNLKIYLNYKLKLKIMKKVILLSIAVTVIFYAFTQDNVLLKIDDEKITLEEFLHIYKKNNTSENAMSLEAMEEYMELFINFKLKVHEAKQMGLDTSRSFRNELQGYRTQLAQPYLTDKSVEEELIREAYERMKYDVKTSHILFRVAEEALPKDTLEAFNKAHKVYQKLNYGADFTEMAKKYSEDESVANNNGNLGYRTVFGLVYPYETVMYETPVGEFSKPVRTNFGYHIVKVTDKRPAKGRYKVAHIMLMTPEGAGERLRQEAKTKIFEIKEMLDNGEDFSKVAKEFSQDRRTAEKGGELGWVTVGGRMIQVFENEVFKLNEIGEISEPLQTNFGWHIIKVLDIEPIKPFEEVERELRSRISNAARASKSKESVIARLSKEYELEVHKENLEIFYDLVTDSIFHGTWRIDEENTNLSGTLLTFDNEVRTQKDFFDYMNKFNRKQTPQPIETFVDHRFRNFINKMILLYEESILEDKYPEFRYLINEYHDGILLFELTDKKVWSKAITDTVGLKKFHESNKDNYMWDYRYFTRIFECKDIKTAERLVKQLNRNRNLDRILNRLNRRDENSVILTTEGAFEKGANHKIDRIIDENDIPLEAGIRKVINLENTKVAEIQVIEPQHKKIHEARGLITADYQNYLEKRWLEELRNKYEVVINTDVLKSVAE